MSSPHGSTLESFVEDILLRPTPALVAGVAAALEPRRAEIEDQISAYDAEWQSWRDYRNNLWAIYVESDDDVRQQVNRLCREQN